MKLRVVSIFNWRNKVWQIGETFEVDEAKGNQMLAEGYVVRADEPEPVAPAAAEEVGPSEHSESVPAEGEPATGDKQVSKPAAKRSHRSKKKKH